MTIMRIPAVAVVALAFMATVSCNEVELITDDEPETASKAVMRPASAESEQGVTRVFEYRPAPGQFINEDETNQIKDADEACAWAMTRMEKGLFVSLGSYGGFITVGFDHSIPATGGYDFAIGGNAFSNAGGASNEPGIVWVMQDSDGNGLPDDTWYQLKGSEWGNSKVKNNYTITYIKPTAPGMPVDWEAGDGNTGQVDYIPLMHKQPYYYPMWLGATLTFTGTCLPENMYRDSETNQWISTPYAWGYADNMGSDAITLEGHRGQFAGFRISNAVDEDGKPANLQFIDFVKVQTGVLGKSGHLGESSTEITGVYDLSL